MSNLPFKNSKPRRRISASSRTKIHQLRYFPLVGTESDASDVLALSTEDGQVLFYTTHSIDTHEDGEPESEQNIPCCAILGQLGGAATGVNGRIKDFEILSLPSLNERAGSILIVTGSSDGALRLWTLSPQELSSRPPNLNGESSVGNGNAAPSSDIKKNGSDTGASTRQVGHLIGSYETGNRITCLKAFVMGRPSVVDRPVQIDEGDVDTGRTEESNDESSGS